MERYRKEFNLDLFYRKTRRKILIVTTKKKESLLSFLRSESKWTPVEMLFADGKESENDVASSGEPPPPQREASHGVFFFSVSSQQYFARSIPYIIKTLR